MSSSSRTVSVVSGSTSANRSFPASIASASSLVGTERFASCAVRRSLYFSAASGETRTAYTVNCMWFSSSTGTHQARNSRLAAVWVSLGKAVMWDILGMP